MARVDTYCVDRWEVSTVDKSTGQPLSPFYPPNPVLLRRVRELWQNEAGLIGDEAARRMPLPDLPTWQKTHRFEPKAVSVPSVIPQAYLSYEMARSACENAGKRLCSKPEWLRACKGESQNRFPYGENFIRSRCNIHRLHHPAFVLHGDSSVGHTDPRLNLIVEAPGDPLLRLTGATPGCASTWHGDAIFDMVGNLDEWVDDQRGVFVGGFYARATTQGCLAEISSHAEIYYDYSTGTRCCKTLAPDSGAR
jgi:hypothetical protein